MESSHQSTITGSIHSAQCGTCGAVVATTRKFCGTCGSRLWEPCLKCGTQNSVAERFCSHCGADLQSALEAAVRLIEENLARSIGFEREGKLLEAAGCLTELPECDHSQLAARTDAARQRRETLINQREQAVARRTAIFEEAQRLRDQRRYAAAHAVLEQIPASLRDQQIRALLAEVVDALQQIKHLRGKLRETLKSGQLDELVESAEQLMRLEPEAEDVRRLCKQLRQRRDERDAALALPLLKQARDAIGANDYSRAEARLTRIAASAIEKLGDDERKTLEGIGERVWLARLLRTAPYADQTLLKLAARLAKLQPDDAQIRKLHAEMTARLARASNGVRPVFVPWTSLNGAWPLGAPVEPLSELPELAWDPANPKVQSWTIATRRHLVAAGLALEGLGAAKLDLELKPNEGASWLTRFTDSRRRRAQAAAWGLDFGTSGLKVVRLARQKEEISVECSGTIPYSGTTVSPGVPDVQPFFAAALKQFLEEYSPGGEPLVVGFPGAQSLGRFFRLPGANSKKIEAALEFEIASQIPLPLDQVVYSTHIWKQPSGGDQEEHHVTLVAAKKSHTGLRLGPFVESHARVWSLQSDCVALLNLVLHCHAGQIAALPPDGAVVLVEVGDAATNIAAISPRRGPWFRTIYRGCRSLNASLVTALGITWQQADELRQTWSCRSMAALDRALLPGIEQLTRELRPALQFCEQALDCQISRIYLAGGGCDQFGMLREWSKTEVGVANTSADFATGVSMPAVNATTSLGS